jgi:hypothetical protein
MATGNALAVIGCLTDHPLEEAMNLEDIEDQIVELQKLVTGNKPAMNTQLTVQLSFALGLLHGSVLRLREDTFNTMREVQRLALEDGAFHKLMLDYRGATVAGAGLAERLVIAYVLRNLRPPGYYGEQEQEEGS